jgi:hypothetical protein
LRERSAPTIDWHIAVEEAQSPQAVKAKRCRKIVVPKDIPRIHFTFIQNVNNINHGQRLSLDKYSQSLRPLFIASTIFAT